MRPVPMPALALFLASTTFCTLCAPASAETLKPGSRLSAVTLYPDAALVYREITLDVPAGSHELQLGDLPAALDPASLRVEGASEGKLAIGNFDLRAGATEDAGSQTARKLVALNRAKDQLNDKIDAVEGRKAMIQRAANPGDKEGQLAPEQWTKAWELIGKGLQAANEELRSLHLDVERIEAEIAALSGDVQRRAHRPQRSLMIALEAPAATKTTLTLSYRVRGASWHPVYDARLTTTSKAPTLVLTRRAMLRQNTGEDWRDARVTLSTLRVARGTAAPALTGEAIGFDVPPPPQPAPMAMAKAARMQDMALAGARRERTAAMSADAVEETRARFDAGDFQGEFALPGTVTLPSGAAEKAFLLGEEKPAMVLKVKSAPALDPTAYLEAEFTHQGEAPLLPGAVMLTRDGAFVGKGQIAMLSPGEKTQLGFGADDSVRIKRTIVSQQTSEPGLLGSNKSTRSEFQISVKNLHAFPVSLLIEDRIPVSEEQAITVDRLAEMTKPNVENPDQRRGIIQWTPVLKGGETRNFTTAYAIRWPADKKTRLTPLPR